MNAAQTAWTILTALFLVCGTVVIVSTPGSTPFAVTCLVVSITGWLTLIGMILGDRR